MTTPTPKSGDLRIETLRGIAIIGVVSHHVSLWLLTYIGEASIEPGLVSNVFVFFSEFFSPLRMPLFTVLSGWVYSLHPVNKNNTVPFFLAKIRRIIFPLFFVSTVFYFFNLLATNEYASIGGRNGTPVPPQDFWMLWFYHYGHLWFLQALTLLFILIALIDRLGLMKNVKQWFFWLTISALTFYILPNDIEFWSLRYVRKIMVFFLFGVGLNRFQKQIFSFRFLKSLALILICSLLIHYFWKRNSWPLMILIGTLAPIYILSLNFTFQPLSWIGKFSYSIYLYHGITWAFLVPICSQLLDNYQWVWTFIFLLLGLILPIVIEKVGEKIPYLRTPLLGRRP